MAIPRHAYFRALYTSVTHSEIGGLQKLLVTSIKPVVVGSSPTSLVSGECRNHCVAQLGERRMKQIATCYPPPFSLAICQTEKAKGNTYDSVSGSSSCQKIKLAEDLTLLNRATVDTIRSTLLMTQ
jgi:hypothetical protein